MSHGAAPGFHGPRSWVLSGVVGAAVGLVLSVLLPIAPATEHGGDAERAPYRVIERLPGGETFERLPGRPPLPLPEGAALGGPLPAPADPAVPDVATGPHSAATAQSPPQQAHQPAHAEDEAHPAEHHAPAPEIPLVLVLPFALMLLSIALMPFINERFWAAHYPDFAFALGALMLSYYVAALGEYGREQMLHVALEYYAFIALVGGLYVVSGGILIDVRGRARPAVNTALLAFGAVLANLVGTTGASVLLIRPFMRLNKGRLRPIHVILFIFIVSNCGGCLTPIGDPPLYLGFLRGVPFFWTVANLWPMWLTANTLLLAIFFVIDARIGPARAESPGHEIIVPGPPEAAPSAAVAPGRTSVRVSGLSAAAALALIVLGVFIDPLVGPRLGLQGYPLGPTFQVLVAFAAYKVASSAIHTANAFSFHPVQEVGFLFVGIFLTMAPALAFLQANGARLGLETPTQYYFGTGLLSAFLDNAPTYLNFVQAAFGLLHLPLDPAGIDRFIRATYIVLRPGGAEAAVDGSAVLASISLGAVFFGAMTYIGNGPNFMVKAIAESSGLKMPSFFGYTLRAVVLLLPVLALVWAVFLRA